MASKLNQHTVPRRHSPRERPRPKLLVMRYSEGFFVQLDGRPDVYGYGRSADEALGAWLLAHGGRLGVEIGEA
jgi:hypothetical protein